MAYYGDLEMRVETAVKELIEDVVDSADRSGYDVVQAIEGGTLSNDNRILVHAREAEEYPGFHGNYMVTVDVTVRSKLNPPDDRTAISLVHRSVTGYVRDAVNSGTLDADLQALVADVKFQTAIHKPRYYTEFEDDCMVSGVEFQVLANPAG